MTRGAARSRASTARTSEVPLAARTAETVGTTAPPSAREIADAWRRERPGTPTASIEVVTPLWRLAKLFADDRARVLREAGSTRRPSTCWPCCAAPGRRTR